MVQSIIRGPKSIELLLYNNVRNVARYGLRTTDHGLMPKIAILGGSGYTALELIKILLRHPAAEIVAVTSRQEETPLLAEVHPSLGGRTSLRCEPFHADRLI